METLPDKLPMATEYLGNKRQLTPFIVGTIKKKVGEGPLDIGDIFSGTGSVSAALKHEGFTVAANDHLSTCYYLTAAALLNNRAPVFSSLDEVETLQGESRYGSVLAYLNALRPTRGGFIFSNYSPASKKSIGYERMYFTESNAARIDTVRQQIESWKEALTEAERALLIADLVRAVSAVSNVAGTYGCYLKHWKSRALTNLELRKSSFVNGGANKKHSVSSMDALEVVGSSSSRILYADPPYTKRQYAAYYHVLETIVRYDNPKIVGSTGLRNWETHSSDFCYRRKAEGALERLLSAAKCEHFFLSYSEDGQIAHNRLIKILASFGKTSFTECANRRYKSSSLAHRGPVVKERLYHVAFA